jgi:hypothetical protein
MKERKDNSICEDGQTRRHFEIPLPGPLFNFNYARAEDYT